MATTPLIFVPCAPGTRKSCDLLRQALQQAVAERPDVAVAEADTAELANAQVVALDAGRDCKASDLLKDRRVKVHKSLYLPDLLAARHLPDPRVPLTEQWPSLVAALSDALKTEIDALLDDRLRERAYLREIAAVAERYRRELVALQPVGKPSADLPSPPEAHRDRLTLAASRFRNQFMRCDEITPPPWLATLHDVFQDACMCMVYALQHWERGEWRKAADYLEQAEHQAGPLLKRLDDGAGTGESA